jgi:hypothetical protein
MIEPVLAPLACEAAGLILIEPVRAPLACEAEGLVRLNSACTAFTMKPVIIQPAALIIGFPRGACSVSRPGSQP